MNSENNLLYNGNEIFQESNSKTNFSYYSLKHKRMCNVIFGRLIPETHFNVTAMFFRKVIPNFKNTKTKCMHAVFSARSVFCPHIFPKYQLPFACLGIPQLNSVWTVNGSSKLLTVFVFMCSSDEWAALGYFGERKISPKIFGPNILGGRPH